MISKENKEDKFLNATTGTTPIKKTNRNYKFIKINKKSQNKENQKERYKKDSENALQALKFN